MRITKPKNENYCATVVEIKNIIPLTGCDNVVGTTIFGYQAIVGKDVKIGDIGIVFPAETRLSKDYCFNNNLYKRGEDNIDQTKKGYVEDSGRVKAVKFRGQVSNCLFMQIDSLRWTGATIEALCVGDSFDELDEKIICEKYIIKTSNPHGPGQTPKSRIESKFLPEHLDTTNFFKNSHLIDPERQIVVTQKIHGTSIRIGNALVSRKLNWFEKILKKLGVNIKDTEYDYIFGSRKVIKDTNKDQNHFYDSDVWTIAGKKLVGLLPAGYVVYGELIGYAPNNAEIQKHYSYNTPKGEAELYVYRITSINDQGYVTELSFDQMVEFCSYIGLKTVQEVWRGKMKDFVATDFIDKRFFESGYKNCLWLGNNMDLVDEGVVIRADGLVPVLLKAKSPKFLELETKMIDSGAEDLESAQS